jgi:hypothetical protein
MGRACVSVFDFHIRPQTVEAQQMQAAPNRLSEATRDFSGPKNEHLKT